MTFYQAFEDFILDHSTYNKANTTRTYREQCKRFLDAFGIREIEDLTESELRKFLAEVNKNPNLKQGTKSSTLRTVRIFLKWLHYEDYPIKVRYEKIKVPPMPKKEPPIYNQADFQKILNCVNNSKEWLAVRDLLAIFLLYDSGIRRGELLGLKRADVVRSGQILTVTGKYTKTRRVKIGEYTEAYIKKYLSICPYDSEWLFVNRYGGQWTAEGITRMLYRLQKKLGFTLSAHTFRHNFATNYVVDSYGRGQPADPFALQSLMGHNSLQTTQVYMHAGMEIISANQCFSHLDMIMQKDHSV